MQDLIFSMGSQINNVNNLNNSFFILYNNKALENGDSTSGRNNIPGGSNNMGNYMVQNNFFSTSKNSPKTLTSQESSTNKDINKEINNSNNTGNLSINSKVNNNNFSNLQNMTYNNHNNQDNANKENCVTNTNNINNNYSNFLKFEYDSINSFLINCFNEKAIVEVLVNC